jgi:hypothetical protein
MTRTLEELREYLVGEWLFQNDFRDTSGNDNHGVPTDVEWKPTERGMKPLVAGSGLITVPYDEAFDLMDDFTLTCTVKKIQSINYGYPRIVGQGSSSGAGWSGGGYQLTGWKVDEFCATIYDGSNASAASGGDDFENGWYTLVMTYKDHVLSLYINGTFVDNDTDLLCNPSLGHGQAIYFGSNYYSQDAWIIGESRLYNTKLEPAEVLEHYNSTKTAYGVQPAERSFTHRLSPEVDENTVFATDMRTKNADGTLIDLSGNSNHGQPTGCVRSGGYFTDGMRFQSDYVEVLASDSINVNDGSSWSAEIFLGDYTSGYLNTLFSCGRNYGTSEANGWAIGQHASRLYFDINTDVDRFCNHIDTQVADSHILCIYDSINAESHVYINGVHQRTLATSGDIVSINNLVIGAQSNYDRRPSNMNVRFAALHKDIVDPTSRFNSLAALPLYEFDFAKYPSNTTVYSAGESLPYSTARVESGSFKVDNGKLQCVTSGQMKLRNAHEFDGDEYIKLTIDDTVYAGTGTITQGTTTASIEQGSTLITVDMVAGDTIDSIDIQFREPVDE